MFTPSRIGSVRTHRGILRYASTASVPTSRERARVVVVGSGRMGQIRAKMIHSNPRLLLCGIVDTDSSRCRQLADVFEVQSFESLSHAVVDGTANGETLHGCVISTSTHSHDPLIREAADNRISVFVEKPVAESAREIDRLFSYSFSAGIDLCCGFQRRFDPSYVAAFSAVQRGEIGAPIAANLFFADHPVPPREFLLGGGNIFMDLLAHDVDYVLNAVQDRAASVYAVASCSDDDLRAAGVHDSASVMLTTQKGIVVTLFLSRLSSYGYDQRCEVFGTCGSVSVQNPNEHSAVLSNALGVHGSMLQHSFPQRFEAAFGLEMDAFADTLLLQRPWPVTREDCVHVQRVADAAQLSFDQGKVITLESLPPV